MSIRPKEEYMGRKGELTTQKMPSTAPFTMTKKIATP
jgi:hypothetical protein